MTSQRDIVLLPFPFSNQKQTKVRPALVLSNNKYNKKSKDIIAVPLTSNLQISEYDLLITNKNLEKGSLIVHSKIKTDKIFSVEKNLIKLMIGRINKKTFAKVKSNFLKTIN